MSANFLRGTVHDAADDLREGKRRPCCWPGCIDHDDKPPGRWQQAALIDKRKR